MKIIVTHKSPDLDAITSVWLIKRFLPNWHDADVQFVPAGKALRGRRVSNVSVVENIGDDEVIHVDTGLGSLDHHQIQNTNVCAASLTLDFLLNQPQNALLEHDTKLEAVKKIVDYVIDEDHFQEVYYDEKASQLYNFSIVRLIDGFKITHPGQDRRCLEFGLQALNSLLYVLEARLFAEQELQEKGIEFETRWGKAVAIETVNDAVLEMAQKKGYVVAVRRDPNHGFIRIKARPKRRSKIKDQGSKIEDQEIDLSPAYEKLKKLDPNATWFFHISKRMLLNGSSKNPSMRETKLSLNDVIKVLKSI